jgi:hypothetical protein
VATASINGDHARIGSGSDFGGKMRAHSIPDSQPLSKTAFEALFRRSKEIPGAWAISPITS